MKKTLLFLSFIIISALSYGQTNLVLNGTGDEHGTGSDSSNTSDNADAFDMTPNSTLNGDIVSPYRYNEDNNPNGWYNSDLADWLEANCGDSDEQPGSTSDGSWDYSAGADQGVKTRGLKINESCRRLYQLVTVEAGKEYTFSIESRSEAENVPSDIFMLNTEITSEDGLTSTSASVDHYFEITNDFNSSKSNATTNNFTLTTFDFTASTNKIVIYVRASAAVDSSNEVFYDNISLVEKATSTAVNLTVSIDVSADPGGVNIVTPSVSGSWAEYAATVDPNDANKYSYTFPDDVTSAEFVWKVYGTSAGDVQESLTGLVGGGAYENNIAAYLPTNNGITTDYSTYCNRTVASSDTYEAPTFIFNSFQQVGVTYTELTVTAPAGNNIVMDYSLNNWSEFHGPGAKDNGDGTHTAIVNADLAFEYKWNDLTEGTIENLTACTNGGGINTDNSTYANRVHTAGVNATDVFNTCPSTASLDKNNTLNAQVYPNPTTGLIFISTIENISGVAVYNLIGKKVLQATNMVNNSIDVSSLSKGMYILKIAGENSIATKKIIKN